MLADLKTLGFKDFKTLKDVVEQKATGSMDDDKLYLMERVIQLVSGLPDRSQKRVDLTNAFLDQLWSNLHHCERSGRRDKFSYRQADGR